MSATPKPTSHAYGAGYRDEQLEKYRNRATNHWRHRIALAHRLVDRYALPRLADRAPGEIVVVDVGCSIGTFAIEFAKRGFSAYGVDFDPVALAAAEELAAAEAVSPVFVQRDVAEWQLEFPAIDIAVAFDLFEHLHDDELGAMLQALRVSLSPQGCLVYHTYPTEFDYVLGRRGLPVAPLAGLPPRAFQRVVRAYASVIRGAQWLATGADHRERIKRIAHCNPTTPERLRDILERAGYQSAYMATAQLYEKSRRKYRRFRGQPVADMNLFGVAWPARGDRPVVDRLAADH